MFAAKNPFEDIVTKATSEELTSENWELNLEVCDKISSGDETGARNCIGAIQKRLVHRNANVQLFALTLADAVAKNCGLPAHQEIASRSFTQTLARICTDRNTHSTVKKRCFALVKEWADEFDDESLGLMKETRDSLKSQGVSEDEPPSSSRPEPTSEQLRAEDEELRRALEISIKDQGGRSNWTSHDAQKGEGSSSAAAASAPISSHQNAGASASAGQAAPVSASTASAASVAIGAAASSSQGVPGTGGGPVPVASRVRALYDFSPTEPGELAFARGEIIRVLDSVYEHWWRGEVRGEAGIFPVNYVEVLPDPTPAELQREAEMEARIFSQATNIDRLLNKLRGLDPARDNLAEDEELQELYQTSLAMRPKIVKLIDRYSNKITELKAMNDKFVRARGSYDEMMEQSLSRYNPGSQAAHNYLQPRPGFQQHPSSGSADYGQQAGWGGAQPYGPQPPVSSAMPQETPSQPGYQPYYYGTSAATGPAEGAPYDDEKRRLYERARAEGEAFQQQHFAQPPTTSYASGSTAYNPTVTDPNAVAQQMSSMAIDGQHGSSYHPRPGGH
ncbi:hypothetical protein BCV70DRAFT_202235 [Testicularia cyperi]|uniref:Class E vacuolar protein-sorting machinery protein HSE1 n=1 Tax=Testicularia cyperi TaxID=1882483 RepID=A0A317XJ20_9BASI|nr:hypothetical protein BCV70DRAFT_202235 [Testicularia cyperi]